MPFRIACLLLLLAPLTGCDSDDPGLAGPGEEELITRVVLTLTPAGGPSVGVAVTDAAGLSGDGQTLDVPLVLTPNTPYQGTIRLLDDSDSLNVEDLTLEVEEESTAHKLRYTPDPAALAVFSDLNLDADGLPLGTTFRVTTGASGTGTLRVQLFHYDGGAAKTADNASDETDVDFRIPLLVQ